MTKKSNKILYFCVMITALFEMLLIYFNEDTSILLSKFPYIVLMVVSNIGLIHIVNLLIKKDMQGYIDIIGLCILTMLFSNLLFKYIANQNNLFRIIQLIITQLASLIKIYIPIIAVIHCGKSMDNNDYRNNRKFKKMFAYLFIAAIAFLLQCDYAQFVGIVLLGAITIIVIKCLEISKSIV